jgi:integrase
MPLTDAAIRTAKPGLKNRKLADAGGLYILVTPKGGRWWRLDYRRHGKRKTISMGTYPEVSLKDARERRDEARKQIANGLDPSERRRTAKALAQQQDADSFEAVAREWMAKKGQHWVESHRSKVLLRLSNDVFHWIGRTPISDIKAGDLLAVLRRVENRGAVDSARRILQNCSQVFSYAMATDRIEYDPCPALRPALQPVKGHHFAAMTDPSKIGGLLRMIDDYQGSLLTRSALKLNPLVFVRPIELRSAEWCEIDLGKRLWSMPGSKMKTGLPHMVPLSKQAVAILEELHPVTGDGKYVFPSARGASRPMSNNTVLGALRRMGVPKDEMTGHGFRAMARTLIAEELRYPRELVEHQLAHRMLEPTGRAYNRTTFLEDRRDMMQAWADYLDKLKAGTIEKRPRGPMTRTTKSGKAGYGRANQPRA